MAMAALCIVILWYDIERADWYKQGRKRPLDTPKRIIERIERERKVEGEIYRGREGERERKGYIG